MGSLKPSCALLCTTTPRRKPASSKPFSTFLSHARRRPAFQVSCNGGREGRVDRRNMLLSLGGLYGAANLIPAEVKAEDTAGREIKAPDLRQCGLATVNKGELMVKCCPPLSESIVDFELPAVDKTRLRLRPAAHKVTEEYVKKFEEGIRLMKELDEKDPSDPRGLRQQANVHCAYCNGAYNQVGSPNNKIQVHGSWLFFPFHRWYVYFFERIMADLIGDPDFSLPFWNWDNIEGMTIPKMLDDSDSPLFNSNRNQLNRPPAIIDLKFNPKDKETDNVKKITNNLSTLYNELIGGVDTTEQFMGKAYRTGDEFNEPGTLERGSHTAAHIWVGDPRNTHGEDMGNFYSAGRDALFYCHHANVDRMWSLWRALPTAVPKDFKDPDYLNASFLFYDENKQLVRVKAGDCTDNTLMGYDYQDVSIPWSSFKPSKKVSKTDFKKLSKGVEFPDDVFPCTLDKVIKVLVSKKEEGKPDGGLVVNYTIKDSSEFISFQVYINEEDDNPTDCNTVEYAGAFSQVPDTSGTHQCKGCINLKLNEIYTNQDYIVVKIIPRCNGKAVVIDGVETVAPQI